MTFKSFLELENIGNELQEILSGNFESSSFKPRVDIYSDEKNIYVEAEIPGVKKENLKINLEKNILTIRGEKLLNNHKSLIVKERNSGAFNRSFELPEEIDPESVEAVIEDGTLKITLAKIQEKKDKKLNIEIR